jgi:hypothetical protein
MNFEDALSYIKQGAKMCRSGWNGKGQWVALQSPDLSSKMTLPYLYISTVDGHFVPWLVSQTDLLAMDWEEVR